MQLEASAPNKNKTMRNEFANGKPYGQVISPRLSKQTNECWALRANCITVAAAERLLRIVT
jgi:hypothetical protein